MLWLIACMWKITWSYDKGILMPLVIVRNRTHHFPLERHAKIMLLEPNTSSVYIRWLRPTFFCTSVESVAEIWVFHCGKSNMSRESPKRALTVCGTKHCLPCHERRVYLYLFIQSILLPAVLQHIFLGCTTFGNKDKGSVRPSFCSWASYFMVGLIVV